MTAEGIMAAKENSVKRYVVRLSADERERLEARIRKGKSPAQRLLKARILLKADVSEAGEGWSDSRIIKALETSVSMVYRVCTTKASESRRSAQAGIYSQRLIEATSVFFWLEKRPRLFRGAAMVELVPAGAGPDELESLLAFHLDQGGV